MKHIILFISALSLAISWGKAQECQTNDCHYLFVIAPDQRIITTFVSAVEALRPEGFELDTTRFQPLLNDVEIRDYLLGNIANDDHTPIVPTILKPFLDIEDDSRPDVLGALFPLFFKFPRATEYNTHEDKEEFLNMSQTPCDGLLAEIKYIGDLTHKKALDKLKEMRELIIEKLREQGIPNDPIFGPDPDPTHSNGGLAQKTSLADQRQNLSILKPSWGSGVTIAIIDTGVTLNIQTNSSQPGFDFAEADIFPFDEYEYHNINNPPKPVTYGHGTQVAYIAQNIAPSSQILPVRVCATNNTPEIDDDCRGSDVIMGVCYALNNKQEQEELVINLSLGSVTRMDILGLAIYQSLSKGVPVIISGGNDKHATNERERYYPAALKCKPGVENCDNTTEGTRGNYVNNGIISVSSVGYQENPGSPVISNQPSEFSVPGHNNDVAAPGFKVTGPKSYPYDLSNPEVVTGTSFAAPVVSGLAAAILSIWTNNNPNDIKSQAWKVEQCIIEIAGKTQITPASNTPFPNEYGIGVIDPGTVDNFLYNPNPRKGLYDPGNDDVNDTEKTCYCVFHDDPLNFNDFCSRAIDPGTTLPDRP